MVKHHTQEKRGVHVRHTSAERSSRHGARSVHVRLASDTRRRLLEPSHASAGALPWSLASPFVRRFCALNVHDGCELDSEPRDLVSLSTRFGSGSMLAELDENSYHSLRVAARELKERRALAHAY